ncbi:MAG TPA: type II toxin-antitoxin system VapC family toxin [Gammaproteobacteria bacterium]|nr:type II toxin-antitoxin system VapC family toxin [Gammaproteobacteria bacterium]
MNLLVDSHLLLWAAGQPEKLSSEACQLLSDSNNQLIFSAASIWEITIKNSLGKPDFRVNPHSLRRGLLDNEWVELPVNSRHAIATGELDGIHKDPFDRILIAQVTVEGFTLLTADKTLSGYPGRIQVV